MIWVDASMTLRDKCRIASPKDNRKFCQTMYSEIIKCQNHAAFFLYVLSHQLYDHVPIFPQNPCLNRAALVAELYSTKSYSPFHLCFIRCWKWKIVSKETLAGRDRNMSQLRHLKNTALKCMLLLLLPHVFHVILVPVACDQFCRHTLSQFWCSQWDLRIQLTEVLYIKYSKNSDLMCVKSDACS